MTSESLYSKILRSSAIYSVAVLVPMAVSVFMLPVFAKYLTTADYAVVELLENTKNLFSMFIGGYFAESLYYYYAQVEFEWERYRLLSTLMLGSLIVGFSGGALGFLLAPAFSLWVFESTSYTHYFHLVFISFALSVPLEAGLAWLRARNNAASFTASALIRLFVQVGLTLWLLTSLKWGVSGVLWSNLVTSVVVASGLAITCLAVNGIHFDWKLFFNFFHFSMPLGLSGLAMFVVNTADRFFLQRVIPLGELGVYALAYKIGMLVSVVQSAFQSYWAAGVYEAVHGERAGSIFARVNTYQLLAVTYFGLLIAVGASPFLHIAAPAYTAALNYIPLIVIAYVIRAEADYFRHALYLDRKVGTDARINSTAALFCLGAYALLIPMAGIWGAIAATISTFVLTFYMARWHLHQHRLYWTELDRVTKLAVAAFVLGSLGFALRNAPLPVTITYAVLAAIAYPVLLYLTRFFEPVEILSIQLRWDKLTHRRPDTFLHLDMK